jgi:hypothetical protein
VSNNLSLISKHGSSHYFFQDENGDYLDGSEVLRKINQLEKQLECAVKALSESSWKGELGVNIIISMGFATKKKLMDSYLTDIKNNREALEQIEKMSSLEFPDS